MATPINNLLETGIGSETSEIAVASVVFFTLLIAMLVLRIILKSKIKKLTEKTENKFDDLIVDTLLSVHWIFYIVISLYFSLEYIGIEGIVSSIIKPVIIIGLTYYAAKSVIGVINFYTDKIKHKRVQTSDDIGIIHFIEKVAKAIVWGFAIILMISNLGYNVTTLVAGLGIGGIAVAFATQNILSDIFSSITIYFDKPFRIGDFIVIGEESGTVEHVGIKSTRIKSLSGEEIVFANKQLTDSKIKNYSKMSKRRISFSIGIEYGTSKEKLEKIPSIIKEIINKQDNITFDRSHFKEFGDFSLNFETVFYVESGSYVEYLNAQQAVNLKIAEEFEKQEISMAFPTQTIHIDK